MHTRSPCSGNTESVQMATLIQNLWGSCRHSALSSWTLKAVLSCYRY